MVKHGCVGETNYSILDCLSEICYKHKLHRFEPPVYAKKHVLELTRLHQNLTCFLLARFQIYFESSMWLLAIFFVLKRFDMISVSPFESVRRHAN